MVQTGPEPGEYATLLFSRFVGGLRGDIRVVPMAETEPLSDVFSVSVHRWGCVAPGITVADVVRADGDPVPRDDGSWYQPAQLHRYRVVEILIE